ncbi:MAG: hypothetical protein COA74_06210 [Gammaproteobacteria bacterium]|nr:MAG: hypothetical protein COA74_14150 [Gammaproteobacteria bacterium]PCJ49155.1 MAG: hypothetical protein COA74_06210 [Gammaproteobacteria bacterium]
MTLVINKHFIAISASPYKELTKLVAKDGAAYLYSRIGTTWKFKTKLTASDGAPGDVFGWAVALVGDTALDNNSSFIYTRCFYKIREWICLHKN